MSSIPQYHTSDTEIDFDSFGVQCDQQEPGCGQCEKRQQQCPGYRNLVDLMFRDESSHVIKKANARARKRGSLSSASSTPSPSLQTCLPVTLTWSPDESSPISIYQGPSRRFSSASSPVSSMGSPPVAFTTAFQVSSVSRERQREEPRVKQEAGTTSLAEIPAPIPCHINPILEERGLNFFVARYVTVVSHVFQGRFLGLCRVLTLACCSLKIPAITTSTCKFLHCQEWHTYCFLRLYTNIRF